MGFRFQCEALSYIQLLFAKKDYLTDFSGYRMAVFPGHGAALLTRHWVALLVGHGVAHLSGHWVAFLPRHLTVSHVIFKYILLHKY